MKINFKKDLIFTFATQIGIFVASAAANILVARLLGAANLGTFSFVVLLGTLMARFSTFGLEVSNIFFIGQNKNQLNIIKSNSFLYWMLAGVIGTILFSFFHYTGLIRAFKNIDEVWQWWVYPIFIILFFEEIHLSVLLGIQQFPLYNRLRFSRHAIFLVAIISMLIFGYNTLNWILNIFVISLFLYLLGLFYAIKPTLRFIDFKVLKNSLKFGLKAYTANIASFLNYRLDMLLVLYFLTAVDLGYYAVAVVIGEKLWYLASASGTVLFPSISSQSSNSNRLTLKTCRLNFNIIFVLSIVLAFISRTLIKILYSAEFLPSVDAFLALLPGIVAMSIPKVLAVDLTGRGKPQFAMIVSIVTLAVNVILNLILIPGNGIVGAALASSVSYSVSAGLMIVFYKKETRVLLKDLLIIKITDLQSLRGFK